MLMLLGKLQAKFHKFTTYLYVLYGIRHFSDLELFLKMWTKPTQKEKENILIAVTRRSTKARFTLEVRRCEEQNFSQWGSRIEKTKKCHFTLEIFSPRDKEKRK
jgi:hypothetical protein